MAFSRTTGMNLCLVLLLALAEPASASPARADQPQRTVVFDLKTVASSGGEASEPKPFLTIELMGQPVDQEVMVILEGDGVVRSMVPMVPGATPGSLSAGVVLDSLPVVPASSLPSLLRIEATFARLHGVRLQRFLTRAAYVTLRPSEAGRDLQTATAAQRARIGDPDSAMGESRPDVPAVPDGDIAEENLVVRPPPASLSGYWGEVKRIMNRRWRQQIQQGLRSERGRDPRVEFRLLADGTVQLIQIERSSGSPRLDEAALQAVVLAQPFPPFPSYLEDDSVDVHIDLRPGK